MSNKDLARSHLANPHQHQSDDEDGIDPSLVYSDTSTPADTYTCSNRQTAIYHRAAQPNRGCSSGPTIELYAEHNRNMQGQQIAGNVTASSLPLTGHFVFNTGNNCNKGELQDVGNVFIGDIKPKKMNDPSKISHKSKQFLTDARSHFRNPKHHQRDDTSEITSGVLPEPNASSKSNYAHSSHSPTTDPPAAQEPIQGESSRRVVDQQIRDNSNSKGVQELGNFTLERTSAAAFLRGGGGVTQVIVDNSNEGEVQRIGNFKTYGR